MEEFERTLISWQLGLDVVEKGKIFDAIKDAANKLTGAALEEFNSLHPRDTGGQFTAGVGNAVKNVVGLGKKKYTASVGGGTTEIGAVVESTWLSSSKVSKEAVETAAYMRDGKRVAKDLNDTFGHLKCQGASKIRFHDSELPPNTILRSDAINAGFGFDIIDDTLQLNSRNLELVKKNWSSAGLSFEPKTLIAHEYMHSLALKNHDTFSRFLPEYEKELNGLVGKRITIANATHGLVSANIAGVSLKKTAFSDSYLEGVEQLKKAGLNVDFSFTAEQEARLKQVFLYEPILKFSDGSEASLYTLISNAANENIVIEGLAARGVYSLGRFDEFLAVKAEQGWKPKLD